MEGARMKPKNFAFLFLLIVQVFGLSLSSQAQLINPMSLGTSTPSKSNGSGAVSRGYIIPSATEIKGGVRITVEIFHQQTNSPVSLYLQMVVNNGRGAVETIPFMVLDDKVADNKRGYRSLRTFDLTYAELNRILSSNSNGGHNLRIGPGTPLFVYALWNNTGHQWGGSDRSGIVYMPGDNGSAQPKGTITTRPTELDLAYPITTTMTNLFNSGARNAVGLDPNGQIRSRVEGEGKFQILLTESKDILQEAFKLANNPSLASRVLGKGWTMKLEDRYMLKDKKGNLVLSKDGLPQPDPMVDTYYDNATYDAAQNDVALRYRWTGGNNSGAWNFKPGMGESSKEGLVYRTEYAVDATDDKPATIQAFADSDHPLNFFRFLRQIVPGSKPSDFFQPSVKIIDHRYKFKLEHKSGLAIEMSIDGVQAESLRKDSNGKKPSAVRFVQVEMDIDHLATQSSNVVTNSVNTNNKVTFSDVKAGRARLQKLTGNFFIDGRPVIHDVSDLAPSSSLRKSRKAEFDLAQTAIVNLRKHLVGNGWIPGAQKYAMATAALGLVNVKNASASMDKMLRSVKIEEIAYKPFAGGKACAVSFKGK